MKSDIPSNTDLIRFAAFSIITIFFLSACGKKDSSESNFSDLNSLEKTIGGVVKNETSATSLAMQGGESCENGDYENAAKLFKQAIDKDSRDGYIYKKMAECQLERKNYELAISDAKKAMALNADYTSYSNELIGRGYHGLGKYKEALDAFQKPDSTARAGYYMSLSYFALGDHKKAIELMSRQIDGGCGEACLFIRGVMYDAQGEYSLALDDFLKSNKNGEYNNDGNYYDRVGTNFYLIGQKNKALENLRKACDLGQCETYNTIMSK